MGTDSVQHNEERFSTHSTDLTVSDAYPVSHECLRYGLSFVYQTHFKHELHASPNARLQGGGN